MDAAVLSEIRVTQRFGVPADRVFNAWIDPAIAGKWLFATAQRPMAGVAIDARSGGSFRFAEREDGKGETHAGQYIELDRPRRLVIALSEEKRGQGLTRVSVEIVPLDAGCVLTLVHAKVPPENAYYTEGRWTGMLYGLAALLGQPGG
jgi:uncharacterized protein YndB with AHSA1/START domain